MTSSDLQALRSIAAGPALRSLLTGVAIARREDVRWIAVTGEDRVRWLNGMVTNSVAELQPGQGCYSFVLSAQGRIQGDCTIYAEQERLLIKTDSAQADTLLELLNRFIIMDDVELALEPAQSSLTVAGPDAQRTLQELGLRVPEGAPGMISFGSDAGSFRISTGDAVLLPQYTVQAGTTSVDRALERIEAQMIERGVVQAGEDDLEALRVLEGRPRFGVDIRERDLPQETGQTQALHFAKGCYLGQEIVERIRSRGSVHRSLSGFLLHGEPLAPALLTEGKPAGELTSIAVLDGAGANVTLGMGYARKEFLLPGRVLTYEGGTAEPVPLPFRNIIESLQR